MNIRRLVLALVILLVVGLGLFRWRDAFADSNSTTSDAASYTVQRRTLEDRVVERGTVESQKTVYGKCDVRQRTKITFIVPEGSEVKKGEKVAAFETTETDNEIQEKDVEINTAKGALAEAEQALEIQLGKNETDIATAKLAFELAVIDLKSMRKGRLSRNSETSIARSKKLKQS